MTDEIWQQPTVKVADMDAAASEAALTSGWPIGAVVDERFRVLEVHGGPGISGMGVVYILESEGRRFAAKTFQHQFAQDLPLIQRFLVEARTWMLLGFHPNIASLRRTVASLQPGERVGWDLREDPAILKALLTDTAPDLDTGHLDTVEHTFWPDVTAYPDFSGDMAWLSEAYGELAHLSEAVTDEERARFKECADLLGFPHRLKRYLERDEAWLWSSGEEELPHSD